MRRLKAADGARKVPQKAFVGATGKSGNLFARKLARRPAKGLRAAPEIVAARVLCDQLGRKRASAEKKRIVHLICLNLLAILKRRSQQA